MAEHEPETETETERDVAGDLIDGLARGGEPVDEGKFSLDPVAAFAKLRAYQLDDPHACLLILVEAGWLAGRGRSEAGVEITTGATTIVEFRGLALDHATLPDLFAAALGRTPSESDTNVQTRARMLQLLGIAANAALALAPESLVLESSTRDGRRTRIRISPSGAVTVEALAEAAPAHEDSTDSTVGPSERHSGRLRFELHGRGRGRERVAAERALVRERCAYTSLKVWLDGELCSRGPVPIPEEPADSRTRTRTRIRRGDEILGIAEHTLDPGAGAVAWIVNRGVAIRDPLERFDHGVRAIVEVDLPVDLSRKQLLEGPELDAIRAAIRASVRELANPPAPPRPSIGSQLRTSLTIAAALVLLPVSTISIERCAARRQRAEHAEAEAAIARARAARPNKSAEAIAQAEAILNATKIDVGALELACELDGVGCSVAADYARDPDERDRLLGRGCQAHDADACAALVAHAREYAVANHDPAAVGLALSQSCHGVAGPDCLEAARHLERGDYPSAEAWAHDPYYQRGIRDVVNLGPDVGADDLRGRGCEAGVVDACAH